MNIVDNTDGFLYITLSRRNLETLMKMLDTGAGMSGLQRRIDANTLLVVQAEENADHYKERTPGIGPEDVR